MSEVSVTVNKRSYRIACDDGQEQHLLDLAATVDQKVGELVSAVGQIGDQRLLVMAALLLADEAEDARRQETGNDAIDESRVAERVHALARRLDDLAARLEQG